MTLSSSSDDFEFDGELFADASFSHSQSSSDDLPPDSFHPFLPTSGRVGDMMTDPEQFLLAALLARITDMEARCFGLNCWLLPVRELIGCKETR
jgi:hypothetical protein